MFARAPVPSRQTSALCIPTPSPQRNPDPLSAKFTPKISRVSLCPHPSVAAWSSSRGQAALQQKGDIVLPSASQLWRCLSHACLHMLKIFSPLLKKYYARELGPAQYNAIYVSVAEAQRGTICVQSVRGSRDGMLLAAGDALIHTEGRGAVRAPCSGVGLCTWIASCMEE